MLKYHRLKFAELFAAPELLAKVVPVRRGGGLEIGLEAACRQEKASAGIADEFEEASAGA